MDDYMLEDYVVDFRHLESGRQFVFEERRQSGVWVKFVHPFNTLKRIGQEWWWASSLPDGLKRACSADGQIQNNELRVRPVRREFEIEVPDFLRGHL